MTWQNTPKARAILSRLAPADLHIVAVTPMFGDRYYRWSAGEDSERLQQVRREAIDRAFGKTFDQCEDRAERLDYIEHDDLQPRVEEVLADLFGSPGELGAPPECMIHGTGIDADLRARALDLAKLAQGHRAFLRNGGAA